MSRLIKALIDLLKTGLIAGLLPTIVFVFLLHRFIAPDGIVIATYTAGEFSPYINRPLPDARVDLNCQDDRGECLRIIDEPVYFSVTPPADNFKSVKVTLEFDPEESTVIELGILRDLFSQSFEFKPIANRFLEELDWPKILIDDDTSDQPVWRFTNPIGESTGTVAYYRRAGEFDQALTVPDSDRGIVELPSVQGFHELLVYFGSGIKLEGKMVDQNLVLGDDSGAVEVYSVDGTLVAQARFVDDSNQLLNIDQPVDSGWYRVRLNSTSDITWKELVFRDAYVLVKGSINLAQEVKDATLFTTASKLTVEPKSAKSLESNLAPGGWIQGDDWQVGEKYQFERNSNEIVSIGQFDGAIKLTGNQKIGFVSSWYDPEPVALNSLAIRTDGQLTVGTDAIEAAMAPVEFTPRSWRKASATFDLPATLERGAYKFALSLGESGEGKIDAKLHSIKVEFVRPAYSIRRTLGEIKRFFLTQSVR